MSMIEVNDLYKDFKVYEKQKGIMGSIKNIIYPSYKVIPAVTGVNFQIREGETVGYIGANGAGKSTTIKMLTGILTPSAGSVTVNGIVPYKDRVKNNKNIGAIFGQRTQMWWDLPPIDTYKLVKKIYSIPDAQFKMNLDKFTEILELNELIHIPVRQLSLGQKMRCEIAMAFLHSPKVVYLDEPTIGLDIMIKDIIRKFIRDINKELKTTILLTTHDMQDISEIASRIIIIDKGVKVYDGQIDTIKKQFGNKRVVKFQVQERLDGSHRLPSISQNDENMEIAYTGDHEINITFDTKKYSSRDVIQLISEVYNVVDLFVIEPTIESIVKDIYKAGVL